MKVIYFFLIPGSLLVACKKGGNEPPGDNWSVPKVKTEQSEGGNTTYFYYDNEGRCVKMEGDIQRYEYTYEPGKVVVKITDLQSNGVETFTYELNAQGYLAKESNSAYTYTQEGYLKTQSTLGNPNRFTNYHYNSATGLLDSMTIEGNGWEQTLVYTYYTDKQQTIGNDNLGRMYQGKSIPHPVKSIIAWRAAPAPVYREKVRTTNYTYLYDEQERIVKQGISTDNASGSGSVIYTYY